MNWKFYTINNHHIKFKQLFNRETIENEFIKL